MHRRRDGFLNYFVIKVLFILLSFKCLLISNGNMRILFIIISFLKNYNKSFNGIIIFKGTIQFFSGHLFSKVVFAYIINFRDIFNIGNPFIILFLNMKHYEINDHGREDRDDPLQVNHHQVLL